MGSKLEKSVNKYLDQMAATAKTGNVTGKGTYGELAVLRICEEVYQEGGGMLYHSYTYKTEEGLAGNIKNEGGKLYVENLSGVTEIDVLLVTPYKVLPVEVKAYKAKKITLTDSAIEGCAITTKSPIHQNEMHCRHLYPKLVRALPDGMSKYIEPIVVMVDECKLEDMRSVEQKAYIKLATLNSFRSCLAYCNRPLDYRLDLGVMEKCLTEACVSCEKKFPLRKIGGV